MKAASLRFLKRLSHHLPARYQIGKDQLAETNLALFDAALTKHELIKISVLPSASEHVETLLKTLTSSLGAVIVSQVGFKIVLYRENLKKPDRIRLP